MKHLKAFEQYVNEELDPSTYLSAAKKLKDLGEHERAKALEDWAYQVSDKMKQVLSQEEIDTLSDFYKQEGKEKLAEIISQVVENNPQLTESKSSDKSFGVRKIIDKIIRSTSILSRPLAVVALLASSYPLAIGLGIAALVGHLAKDAAWWKKGGTDYESMDRARKGWDPYYSIYGHPYK